MTILAPDIHAIKALAKNANLNEIHFAEPPSREALVTLECEILQHRKDFDVRFYGFYRSQCDLSFLQFIPSVSKLVLNCLNGPVENIDTIGRLHNLTSLTIGIMQLQNLNFLTDLLPILEALSLEETTSKSLSLKPVLRFARLRQLYIERHHKDIAVVGQLPNLESLVFRSVTVPSLSFLTSLSNLQILDLKLGGTTNLDALSDLLSVRRLEIWQVRKLQDIGVVTNMRNLDTLYLQDLPNIVNFPSLAGCSKLTGVYIHHLKNLADLSPIADAPNLETLAVGGPSRCSTEAFKELVNHHILKTIWVGLGRTKNSEIRALFDGTTVKV